MKETYFERAVFLSWYCSKRDCAFCYMSTLNNTTPQKSRRKEESILAEAFLSYQFNWEIEFISGGYEACGFDTVLDITKKIQSITGQKQWLNVGALSHEELSRAAPWLEGVAGTLECANPTLRERICPSKPLSSIESMFEKATALGLKKTATVIIGLGETIEDFRYLRDFIQKHQLDKITFYALNPHPGTPFTSSPSIDYYTQWIHSTRDHFPHITIVAGAWSNKAHYYADLLRAGADNITKLPALKIFGRPPAYEVKRHVESAGHELRSNLIELPQMDWRAEVMKLPLEKELKQRIADKVETYIEGIRKRIARDGR